MKADSNQQNDATKPVSMAEIAPVSFLISTVAKQLRRAFDEHAKSHDLTMPQWRVLAQLAASKGLTQAALAGQVEADPMTVSGILDRLEQRGLVVRAAAANDSRAKIAEATPQALKIVADLRADAVAASELALRGIADPDRAVLIAALTQISKNMSACKA